MTNRRLYAVICAALIFFINPVMNITDVLPDFIAYIMLFSLFRTAEYALPYFYEVKSGLLRLMLVGIGKTLCTVIMYANLGYGQDIVPLFTLIFDVFELILIIKLINDAFSAIYYFGERAEGVAVLSSFKCFRTTFSPENVKGATLIFIIARQIINFLPELCLLTYDEPKIIRFVRNAYPIFMIMSLAISLALGVLWFILARAYLRSALSGEKELGSALYELCSEEKLGEIEKKANVKRITKGLTLFAFFSIFSFDVILQEFEGVNLLPHFIYYLLLLLAAFTLFEEKRKRVLVAILSLSASAVCTVNYFFTIRFYDSFSIGDLLKSAMARTAYEYVEIFTAIESALAVGLALAFGYCLIGFIKRRTGVSPDSDRYSRTERDYHKRLVTRAIILSSSMALLFIAKCMNVFFKANVKLIWSDNVTDPVVEASLVPWFGIVVFALSLFLVFFSFIFTSELKEEIKMKEGVSNY